MSHDFCIYVKEGLFMKKTLCIVLIFILSVLPYLSVFAKESGKKLPSGIVYSDIEKTVDDYVEKHRSTTAAVSVAVFTGSDVLMKKAYGYLDIENAVINDMSTVFEWGSTTKLLVWTSVMQLKEEGKLSFNEDIRTYLPPGFLTKLKYDTPITMLNLMNHNAGWQETLTDLFIEDREDIKELGDALKLIEPEQINEPGNIVAYSNWGSALAGYIVERISGQPFDVYVHEHIFEPLGMKHTALNADLSDNEWVAKRRREEKCYTNKNESLGTNLYYISLYPAGMATGTIEDFIKFGQAFLKNKGEKSPLFKKKETLDEMLSPSMFYADGKTGRNHHGFWKDQLGVPVLWHNGGTLGSSSWFAFNPESSTGIIIFTNQRNESVYNCGLLPMAFGKYQGNTDTTPSEDISGMYISSRTVFKGFGKPYSLVSTMEFKEQESGLYTIPGSSNNALSIGKNSYLMDMGGLKQFVIYAATNKEGLKVLQLPAEDYVEINGYGVIAKFVLLGLFILSALYGFVSLIFSLISLLKYKRTLDIIEKYCAVINTSVVAAAMMVVYISLKLFSNAPLIKDIIWCMLLIGILSLLPLAYVIFLAVEWKKYSFKRKDKIKLIITGAAGLIMTTNILLWESYKFW